MEIKLEIEEVNSCGGSSTIGALPLISMNHVSLLCRSLWDSIQFYKEVLGFVLIKRPSSFDFPGAWLFNYGIGIHLLETPDMEDYDPINNPRPINPKDNHISFQCTDIRVVRKKLQEWGIRYTTAVVEEGGIKVDQVFFHDPDGYMIEICNCDNIPILPISSATCPVFKPPSTRTMPSSYYNYSYYEDGAASAADVASRCGLMEAVMMESLSMDMITFSF